MGKEELKRKSDETEEEYLWRIGQLIDSGKYENWAVINEDVNKALGIDEEKMRDESSFRKRYQAAKKFYDNCFSKRESKEYIAELAEQQRTLQKTKIQIQTEKLEYNKWLREEARDELITEKICDTIRELQPLKVPEYIEPVHNKRSQLLVICDAHYGVEFSIPDLFGDVINEYSPEIFEKRMWDLFNQVIEIVKKEGINELTIFECGDGIDGLLRLTSQLMKLRYGVIESSILYASFLSEWLNKLSKYVRIKFQMVIDSNHNQLRLLGAPKNAFAEENMSKIMITLIKERLKNNPNVVIIENPTGMNFALMATYAVLGTHGENKGGYTSAINDISRAYNTHIDYLVGGHIHHSKSEEVGIDSEVLNVRSIIGVDEYGLSLNKTANAGASLFTFEQGKGLVREDKIKLS